MGYILRDFKCEKCELVFEQLVESPILVVGCGDCGGNANITIKKIAVHGCESFNEHYDEQVGQHFVSAEHKKEVLKRMGMTQTAGPNSPRKSNKTNIIMNKGQARKFDPFMDSRRSDRQEEIKEKAKEG